MREVGVLLATCWVLLGCDPENAKKTWVSVAPGALDITVTADGRFLANVGGNKAGSQAGIAQATDDPTRPWPFVASLLGGDLGGSSTGRPFSRAMGRVFVARSGTWEELQQVAALSELVAVDASGAMVTRARDGALSRLKDGVQEPIVTLDSGEVPTVAPDGRVFAVNVATGSELWLLAGGKRTPLLGTTGCLNDSSCSRRMRLIGFDETGGVYVAIILPDRDVTTVFLLEGTTWRALPPFAQAHPDGQISCAVSGRGAVYCQSKEDFGNKLYRLDRGAAQWSDLGGLDTVSACDIRARDDGRVALRCGAQSAQSGNSELFVSTN